MPDILRLPAPGWAHDRTELVRLTELATEEAATALAGALEGRKLEAFNRFPGVSRTALSRGINGGPCNPGARLLCVKVALRGLGAPRTSAERLDALQACWTAFLWTDERTPLLEASRREQRSDGDEDVHQVCLDENDPVSLQRWIEAKERHLADSMEAVSLARRRLLELRRAA